MCFGSRPFLFFAAELLVLVGCTGRVTHVTVFDGAAANPGPGPVQPSSMPQDAGTSAGAASANSPTSSAAGSNASAAGSSSAAGNGSPQPTDAAGAGSAPALDPFGVRKLYPTLAGGREWFLPADAQTPSNEWNVERNRV